jgi:hypothetical protein
VASLIRDIKKMHVIRERELSITYGSVQTEQNKFSLGSVRSAKQNQLAYENGEPILDFGDLSGIQCTAIAEVYRERPNPMNWRESLQGGLHDSTSN